MVQYTAVQYTAVQYTSVQYTAVESPVGHLELVLSLIAAAAARRLGVLRKLQVG